MKPSRLVPLLTFAGILFSPAATGAAAPKADEAGLQSITLARVPMLGSADGSGGYVTVEVKITYTGTLPDLAVRLNGPSNKWTFENTDNFDQLTTRPAFGTNGKWDFGWSTVPASPVVFRLKLRLEDYTKGQAKDHEFYGTAKFSSGGELSRAVKILDEEISPGAPTLSDPSVSPAPTRTPAAPVGNPPVITAAPISATVPAGGSTTLSVTATSPVGNALLYQWRRNGVDISGATAATYPIPRASQSSADGLYSVLITNATEGSSARSAEVSILTTAPNSSALHSVVVTGARGYRPGGLVTITNTLTYTPLATVAIGWQARIPAGWTYVSDTAGSSTIRPTVGTTDVIEFAWSKEDMPKSPYTFTYTLRVPENESGTRALRAIAYLRQNSENLPVIVLPDPLPIPLGGVPHEADSNKDWRISLDELERFAFLYATMYGTNRSGVYQVATDAATVDGYTADKTRAANSGIRLPRYHTGDTDFDGDIDLFELLRMIEFYGFGYKAGARTGEYHAQPGTEDGYAVGP